MKTTTTSTNIRTDGTLPKDMVYDLSEFTTQLSAKEKSKKIRRATKKRGKI